MAKVDIQTLTAEVQERIKYLQAASGGTGLRPAWQIIGNFLVNRIKLGFRLSRSPWGAAWLPIKWRTPRVAGRFKALHGAVQPGMGKLGIFTKKRDANGQLVLTKVGKGQVKANATGKAGQPLVDTGRLRRSIVAQVADDGVTVGTNLIYAATHQFGATIRPKKGPFLVFAGPSGELVRSRVVKIPARPFMPINAAGALDLPPSWAVGIIRTLAAHFKLGADQPVSV